MKNNRPKSLYLSKVSSLKHRISQGALGLSAIVIIGCSGGGTGSDSTTQSQSSVDYTPSAERLMNTAESSDDLYVEESFKFDHYQTTNLSIHTNDANGEALSFAKIRIYLIDSDLVREGIDTWRDELSNRIALISAGLSDANGHFERLLEIPNTHNTQPTLLIEVNAVGIENKVLAPIVTTSTDVTIGTAI